MKRYLSAFLLSAALLVPVAGVKADDDHHHHRRYYDRGHRDYHVYDSQEDRAYRSICGNSTMSIVAWRDRGVNGRGNTGDGAICTLASW